MVTGILRVRYGSFDFMPHWLYFPEIVEWGGEKRMV